MSLWTSAEAVAATGGEATRDWQASGVSIDTRTLAPGDLFIALKAARDGHDFVAQALDKGAAAALVTHRPEGVAPDAPLLIVPDVQAALEALGHAARARSGARVLAITGSVGKTSTKEMARAAFSRQGTLSAAVASYNNHWGVPLSLMRMAREAEIAVLEIGMSHPGEIAPLAKMVRPHVALVTTIAPAHLEAFENIEGIAEEKASVAAGLVPGGVAVLPADLPTSPILAARAEAEGARVVTFGSAPGADAHLVETQLEDGATVARIRLGGQVHLIRLASAGRHFAANAAALLAAAEAMGLDVTLVARDLALWQPPDGRGARERIVLDPVDELSFELIDDAFNANPASMGAALEVLAAAQPGPGGRRVAVLGDMLALGEGEGAMHAALADLPALDAVDVVHCAGERMRALWQRLPAGQQGRYAAQAEELAAAAHRLVAPGDIVLVKGSKAARASLVVDALRKLRHPVSGNG
ncbi:MAG: UDP-N-acetylmuramoyl-tripeptide--D-alanyl-D-alanine ligase [Rhodobacterales bacterium]|nr:MAG: UDP-N-acetylmuramoyl-tripeptide--D-alanyl-D-alanine ligase [Rhodobacterales bacterium]